MSVWYKVPYKEIFLLSFFLYTARIPANSDLECKDLYDTGINIRGIHLEKKQLITINWGRKGQSNSIKRETILVRHNIDRNTCTWQILKWQHNSKPFSVLQTWIRTSACGYAQFQNCIVFLSLSLSLAINVCTTLTCNFCRSYTRIYKTYKK